MNTKLGNASKTQNWGYFFVLPFIVVYALFSLYPTIYTLFLGFTDLRGFARTINIVGGANFARLVQDTFFWRALGNTFIMWMMNFSPQIGIALILSIWLSDIRLNLKLKGPFRTIVYMPNLLTAASVALLFRSLFAFPVGPVNQLLVGVMGIVDPSTEGAWQFFRNPNVTRGIVAFIQWWMWYGHTIILLMAGITSISESLYEAAVVDGANSRQISLYITLPLLKPIMLYILVTSMIGGMQMLEIPFLLTDMRGAPDFSIATANVYMYNIAFQGVGDLSYAAAISIGMFVITFTIAMFMFFFLQDRSDLKKGGH